MALPLPCYKGAAQQGDTLLPFAEIVNRITKRFPERRTCRPDKDLVLGQASFYQEALDFRVDGDPPTMALKWLSELEREVSSRLPRRTKAKNPSAKAGWSWEKLLLDEFGKKSGSKLPPEVEERARKEKAEALAKLYESRFSVLCGRAGTGKTSVLKVFLKGLEELDGKRPILLLAPTGKARVRLMDRTKRDDGSVRDAYTIHQFLMRQQVAQPRKLRPEAPGRRTARRTDRHHRRSVDDPDGPARRSVPGVGLEQGEPSDPGGRPEPIAAHRSRSSVRGHHRLARSRRRSERSAWPG